MAKSTPKTPCAAQELTGNELSRAVLETVPIGVFLANSDGEVIYVNPAFERLSGYVLADVVNNSWGHTIHIDDRPRVVTEWYLACVAGVEYRNTCRLICKDESQVWIRVTARKFTPESKSCYIGTIEDITAKKEAEDAAVASDHRFKMIADVVPVRIWATDVSGKLKYVNKAWAEFSGHAVEDIIRRGTLCQFAHRDDQEELQTLLDVAIRERKRFRHHYRARRGDGEYRWILNEGVPLHQPNGAFSGFIGCCVDITDAKLAQEASMNAWRIERMEEFVQTLVHDLKAPLVGADRVLEMLVNRSMGDLNSRQLDAISLLKAGNNHKLTMIQKLLDVYLLESGQQEFTFEPINIRTLISDSIIDVAKLAEQKSITIEFECMPSLMVPTADRRSISEVMSNLLRNALTYSPEGGRVDIKAQNNHEGIIIRVVDTGPGISTEEQAYLFYHFAQGQSGSHYVAATGFGLYISRLIVEAHGGTISCQSQPGLGSVFSVWLPLTPKKAAESTQAQAIFKPVKKQD